MNYKVPSKRDNFRVVSLAAACCDSNLCWQPMLESSGSQQFRIHQQWILANNQLDSLSHIFIYLFIPSFYMFRASSAHHQEIELY